MTFQEWMKEVDTILNQWFSVTSDALIDYTWRDCFDEDLTPRQAVECFVEDGVSEGDLPESFMTTMFAIMGCEEADHDMLLNAK